MPVIKSDKAEAVMGGAVVLDLGDIGRQAAKLRADAQAKAKQILDQAQAKADELVAGAQGKGFEQGRAAGFEQGLAEGREQGQADGLAGMKEQLAQLQATWQEAVESWEAQRGQLEADARQAVIRFALCMAEKLVHRTVEVDSTVIVDQVAAALSHVLRPTDMTVRIHPGDRAVLQQAMQTLLSRFDHLTHVHLVDDQQITAGGCVVTFGQGRIDATVQTQIQRVVQLMVPGAPAEQTPDTEQADGEAKSDRE